MEEIAGKVEDIIKRADDFEKTVQTLLENIRKFKKTLEENKKKYGSDTSKWPTKKD